MCTRRVWDCSLVVCLHEYMSNIRVCHIHMTNMRVCDIHMSNIRVCHICMSDDVCVIYTRIKTDKYQNTYIHFPSTIYLQIQLHMPCHKHIHIHAHAATLTQTVDTFSKTHNSYMHTYIHTYIHAHKDHILTPKYPRQTWPYTSYSFLYRR